MTQRLSKTHQQHIDRETYLAQCKKETEGTR
jgi:hypothetical protein